jgi:GNAT superfamily N-acetyltransferase
MGDRLEARGFSKIASEPMMSIDLNDLPEQKRIPGLAIKPVRSEEEMKMFDRVLETQFRLGEAAFKKIHEIECSLGFEEDCPRHLYVAYQDGIPVSTNFMILDDDVVGWYKIATHPDYCRRGIGTAVTLAPMYDARERGYNVGVLQSTEAGLRVYSRLGFKEDGILDWYMYTWDKEAKAW